MAYVYAFYDENGEPYYVGATKDMPQREKGHRSEIRKGNPLPCYRKARKLIAAGHPFVMRVVEETDTEDAAFEREITLIKEMREKGFRLLNVSGGGDRPPSQKGVPKSESHKKKIGDSKRGKKRPKGFCELMSRLAKERFKNKPMSGETKLKMSLSHKGKKPSPQAVEATRRRSIGNKIWLGRKHSEESKRKISQTQKKMNSSLTQEQWDVRFTWTEEKRKRVSETLKDRWKTMSEEERTRRLRGIGKRRKEK